MARTTKASVNNGLQLEKAENAVETVTRQTKSRQPRFSGATPDQFFASVLHWITDPILTEQPYKADSRERDKWLRNLWPAEPHLAGILNSIVLIDANRGWNLIGGRNQVNKYIDILHSLENGEGYRYFVRLMALAFRTADLGCVAEIGREGRTGPMRTLWNVDPVQCKLTGDIDTPLEYTPPNGKPQSWRQSDFFRLASMVSTDETLKGLGYCGVSRAYEVAKTMIAVFNHDHEQLGARMPQGLLLLSGISQDQWDEAMTTREANLDAYEREYYGGVAILASAGMEQIDAKLMALSSLPKDFDRKVFTDLLMYVYALTMGYSPDEFWPVQGGTLGRGQEVEIQHRKATSKGVLDFPIFFQEKLQALLPGTLQFEFEERDVEGEMLDAQAARVKADLVASMYLAGLTQGQPLIDRDEARTLLVEQGIIPAEWTEQEEMVQGEDQEPFNTESKERIRSLPNVQRAAIEFPEEPIVQYRWPSNRMRVLWVNGTEMMGRRTFAASRVSMETGENIYRVRRQGFEPEEPEDDPILFQEGDIIIRESDVNSAIAEGGRRVGPEFAEVLNAPIQGDTNNEETQAS